MLRQASGSGGTVDVWGDGSIHLSAKARALDL